MFHVVSFDKFRYFQRILLPVELSNRLLDLVLSPWRRPRNDPIRAERLTNLQSDSLSGIHNDRRIGAEGLNQRNHPGVGDVEKDERSPR